MADTAHVDKGKVHGYCVIQVELDNEGQPLDWTVTHANEELAQLEGKPLDQLVGLHFSDFFPNGNRKWLTSCYEAAYLGKSLSFEEISEHAGVYLHVEAYPTERVGYCACVVCDIKENIFARLKQQEEQEALLKAYGDLAERDCAMQQAAEHAETISALSTIYTTIMEADLKTHGYKIIQTNSPMKTVVGGKDQGDFDEVMENVLEFYMHPDDIDRMREFIDLSTVSARLGSETSLVTEYRAPYGKWFESRFIAKKRDEAGHAVSAIYAARDVTAEKLKELHYREQLKEQLAIFDALARNFKNVFLVDTQNATAKILKLEDEYTGHRFDDVIDTEFSYESLLNDWIRDVIHPDDQATVQQSLDIDNLRKIFAVQDEYTGTYRRIVDGQFLNYQFTVRLAQDGVHLIVGFQNVDSIIRKHLEEEKKRQEKEQAYQNQLKEQLMISDTLARNFRNVYLVNLEEETVKILKLEAGYVDLQHEGTGHEFPFDVILDNWIHNVVCPEDRTEISKIFTVENVKKRLAVENEFTGNYRSIIDGKTHYYQYNISKANEDGTKAILGFQGIDDIIYAQLEEEEKRRKMEQAYQEQLKAAAEEAKQANKTKTEFLLRMSHDIRTPLNGIRGMLDMADYYGGDLEKVKECREKVRESSNILLELINEVLDMSRLESGKVVLERVPFDLVTVSSEIFTVVEKLAEEQDIELIEDCTMQHTRFIGSPLHFKRLILNILGNAIKYNRPHGKVYITSREVSFDGKTVVVETVIRDTGIGMSEEFQKHLFEPFQQENDSARTNYDGTGLGMPIAKNLTEKMGGTISFESEKNVGTTFTVQIPFEVDFSEHIDVAQDGEEDVSIAGETVILAEDNEINLEISRFILKQAGVHIIEARNGKEAVCAFTSSKPGEIDAILMDLMMPVMDGYEATRCIRTMDRPDAKTIPIIAMTANAFAEDRIATKKAGMNAHIAKPLNAQRVIRIIAEQVKASQDAKTK